MKKFVYLVKSPNPEKPGEYIENRYNTVKELADALEIGNCTAYMILNGTCKFNYGATKKLKNFIFTKEFIAVDVKLTTDEDVNDKIREKRRQTYEEIERLKKELHEFEIAENNKVNDKIIEDLSKKFIYKLQNKTS